MKCRIPRLMIAAPKSGSGKTLITCALLGALKNRRKDVIAFKCGPDYIDPMFHRKVQGIPAENLDTWFSGAEGTRELFTELADGHEIAVMEGVMGLFDGLGGIREEGSAYHLATVTDTPILLVVDVHGMGASMVPMIQGFLSYDKKKASADHRPGRIAGVILNRISGSFYETMKPVLQEELSVPVVGYFPNRKDLHLESRHLGLQLPDEMADLKDQLQMAAEQFESTVDVDLLLELAEAEVSQHTGGCESCVADQTDSSASVTAEDIKQNVSARPRLAVARDEAFCFYYEANIRALEKAGAEIVYFSPLHDQALPENIAGLLLGGGYPELYGSQLAANLSMRESIRQAIGKGMPSLAECGGFMYLHECLTDPDGNVYPMAGVIPATAEYKGKLVRFGYAEISSERYGKLKAHEFHYYDSTSNGDSCVATKPVNGKSWSCIHESENHFWGFPHLYYPSNEEFAEKFVEQMERFMTKKSGIIMLSFGTTYADTRKKNIHALTELVKAEYQKIPVVEAFSSGRVRKVLRERDGIVSFSLEEAMEEMVRLGVKHLVICPTHILGGLEYEKCRAVAEARRDWFETLSFGSPLLGSEEDYPKVAKAFWDGFSSYVKNEESVVLMGHGTTHVADESYQKLERELKHYSGKDVHIATVEGNVRIEDVVTKLKSKKVVVAPFMLVAGDHAVNDMAGEEDSFASVLKEHGFEPVCIVKGIGEYPEIKNIYLRNIRCQM